MFVITYINVINFTSDNFNVKLRYSKEIWRRTHERVNGGKYFENDIPTVSLLSKL